jgi:hypothetical protein
MQDGSRRGPRPGQNRRDGVARPGRPKGQPRKGAHNDLAGAKRIYEHYMALARAAAAAGDAVERENCYQHAEHYFRIMRAQTA